MTFYDYMEEKNRRSEEERKRLGWGGRYNWGQEGYTPPESEEIGNLRKVMALREAEPTNPYTIQLTEKRLAEVAAGKTERPMGVEDVEVYQGGVQTAGPGYTPEAEATEYARRMTKTINRYDETGKVIGTVEVPDWEKRAEGVMKPELTAAETAQRGGQASLFSEQAKVVGPVSEAERAKAYAEADKASKWADTEISVAKINAEAVTAGKGASAGNEYMKERADVVQDITTQVAKILGDEKFYEKAFFGKKLKNLGPAGQSAIEEIKRMGQERLKAVDAQWGVAPKKAKVTMTEEEWVAAAQKVNPGVTPEVLRNEYRRKYGGK